MPLSTPTLTGAGDTANELPGRPQVAGWTIAGLAIVGLFLGTFGAWAGFVPLDGAAIAPGVVSVAGKRKTIQHLEGGIIREILVTEGSFVEAGQPSVRLDDTRARESLGLLRDQYEASLALEARLIAERDEAPSIVFGEIDIAGDDGALTNVVREQIDIFEARRTTIDGRIAVLRERIARLRREVKGAREQLVAEEEQLRLVNDEMDGVALLVNKGLATKTQLLELQRLAAEIDGRTSALRTASSRGTHDVKEAKLQISNLENTFHDEVVGELRDVSVRISDLEHRMRAAEDVLQRTEITAPLAGIVVNLQHHTLGGVIAPGEPILDIVPRDEELVVEARVDPRDIDVVHAGLSAQVRLTSYSMRSTPPLDGVVSTVSADQLIDDKTGAAFFSALIEISPDSLAANRGIRLYPGMPAETMILTERRTAIDYFLEPLMRSFNRAFRED